MKVFGGAFWLAVATVVATMPVEAKSRFSLDYFFGGDVPPPPRHSYFRDDTDDPADTYLFDDQPDSRPILRQRPPLDAYDPDFYEPRYVPDRTRIDRVRQGLAATNKKSTTKRQPAQALAAPEPVQPKVTAKPPAAATTKTATSSKSASKTLSCDKAASIVGGYGFSEVKAKSCTGDIYAFAATRGGKNYDVRLSAATGELTEVRRQ